MSDGGFIDELERDLGQRARLLVIQNAGGQRRYIPLPSGVRNSVIAREMGSDIAYWLAGRFGGEEVMFPSKRGATVAQKAAALMASVLEAGLTDPVRSANDIAHEHGVSVRRVWQIRQELRDDVAPDEAPKNQADLFE